MTLIDVKMSGHKTVDSDLVNGQLWQCTCQ